MNLSAVLASPHPLPVHLTVGDAGAIHVGDVLVDIEPDPGTPGQVIARPADGRNVAAHLADLLEATAAHMRTPDHAEGDSGAAADD